mmetsp:Transcript_10660/g.27120  ORF Transcript_10660/g.27120 Transcript_10660/m.27120 type:complete len:196 (-) Transcript_10660:431-1018(-)
MSTAETVKNPMSEPVSVDGVEIPLMMGMSVKSGWTQADNQEILRLSTTVLKLATFNFLLTFVGVIIGLAIGIAVGLKDGGFYTMMVVLLLLAFLVLRCGVVGVKTRNEKCCGCCCCGYLKAFFIIYVIFCLLSVLDIIGKVIAIAVSGHGVLAVNLVIEMGLFTLRVMTAHYSRLLLDAIKADEARKVANNESNV